MARRIAFAAAVHARHRVALVSRLALVAAVVGSIAAATAEATGPSTITFAEHPAATVIDTEYAAQGVRFGTTAALGAPALAGAWNCGAPQVKEPTSDGGPPPRVAQAPLCGGRSGTVAAFAGPRKSIRVLVDATPSTTRQADVLAYAADGALLTSSRVAASRSAVTIDRPTPDVVYLAIQLTGEGDSALLFDDLQFDHLGDTLALEPRGVGATVGVERTDNVARLTDADPTATASDYRVTIEWGDGQTSEGRVVRSGDGYDVVGTHTYTATGAFAVRTTVEKVNGVRATATSSARVVDRPDFVVAVTPLAASVSQGTGGRFTVSVTPLAGFTGTVSLSLTGASGTFSPATVGVPGTSQLTVGTSRSTAPRAYPLTITATGGSLSRSATATLTVAQAPPIVVARLTAPRRTTALSPVTLDARPTSGAARFLWDLNGDRRPDVECGKSTPVLVTRLRTPGRRTVSLTAVALDGRRSITRQSLQIGKRRATGGAPEVARCLRDPRNSTQVTCTGAFRETVVFGLVEAVGCFTRAARREDIPAGERRAFDEYRGDPALADPLVSRQRVTINGLTFSPIGGASILVFPQIRRIVSARAEIRLGGIRVREAGAVNLVLADPISSPALGKRTVRARLLVFDPSSSPLTQQLGGFGLTGTAELFLVRKGGSRGSETRVSLAAPPEMRLFGGDRPTGQTTLAADNGRGLVLDELRVVLPEANFGAVRLTNVSFEYKAGGNPEFQCEGKWWKATANVFLGPSDTSGGFRLAPEPRRNGLAFCNGSFHSAGGEVVFDPPLPRPQLFPGVELKTLGFEIQLQPTVVLVGTATIGALRLGEVRGGVLVAFPTPSAPYRIEAGDAKGALGKLVGRTFTAPTIAVGGTFSLRVTSSLAIPFGNAYLAYSAPDYIAFGGGMQVVIPGGTIRGAVDGEMRASKALWSVHGSAEFCLLGLLCPVVGAEAWVTSTGVVVCGSIAGALHPGFGYRWGSAWPDVWLVDGCEPSPYWVNASPDALSRAPYSATATSTFTVARGERSKNVRLIGIGGAPRVEVRGPDGEVVSTAAGDLARGRTINILRQEAGRATWIGVAPAVPGRYTVTTLPGSPAVGSVAATRPVDDHVRASVSGSGSERLLRYDVARIENRRVTFFERGRASYRMVGSVTGGRGTLRFSSAPGASGPREIVARVELRGVPSPDRVVARYRVAAAKRLARPEGMRLRRTGGSVSVDWAPVAGATGYAVVTRLGNGVQRVTRVPGTRTELRLAAIPLTEPGAVTVLALGPFGSAGPAARDRFAAPRREPSPFLPFSELGRGAARR
jgi:hypothetical protein